MLAGIERELASEPVVVIGVHSPKFPAEADVDAVRDAVRRYEVSHPVVVDTGHRIWQRYGVRAWPTLVVVDPEGCVVAAGSGEPDPGGLVRLLREVLERHRAKGTLVAGPLPLRPEPGVGGQLRYPSKVLAAGGRLVISDAGHHRLLVGRVVGEAFRVELVVGGPEPGLADGPPQTARFRHPCGTALVGGALYVADAGNHALRAVSLRGGGTVTVAGTGAKGGWPLRGGEGRRTALRSPWDLAWDTRRRRLYVAMAGSHQIWAYDPASGWIEPFAGSGLEARADGPREAAAFAQPSGLALAADRLYVADSEASAVREVGVDSGVVRTVCGGDLFDFGDRDGRGDAVRLQHPMGVAADPQGAIWVADTYNHKVKRLDPRSGECVTVYGSGVAGSGLDPRGPLVDEPEGLAVLGPGDLVVADTNNHRILRLRPGRADVLFA